MTQHPHMPVCEAVGTDGTGHMVKLGQAAQAKEETFEARQHLQLPVILTPILFAKSGWRGGESAGSQGTFDLMLFPLPPSNPPQCPWLPGPTVPHYGCSKPHAPQTPCWLYFTLWTSPQGGEGSCHTSAPQQSLVAARAPSS